MNIEIIDPLKYRGWDNLILSHPDYSFFHSSIWAEVLKKSYGYTPLYFVAFGDNGISALLPVMEVKSILTGRRGVSLPFTDHCPPIINGSVSFEEVFHFAVEHGRKSGWKTLELRGGQEYLNIEPSEIYLGHTLSLSKGEQLLFKELRDSTKRNIKKAMGEGVEVKISDQPESIEQFYHLNSVTRKRHGLPPQPFSFFKNVLELVIKKGHGIVVVAFYEGEAIAASVFFHLGTKAVYKYGASDLKYQNLRANNLVMWEAIRFYCGKGFDSLSLGRTDPENYGLIQFKSGWGTTEQQINYYRYNLTKGSFVSDSSKVSGFHNKIFSKMPIPILNRIGNILYKHVG
jgi:hypothetical protein